MLLEIAEKLQQFKKGMMQQLFLQQIRFLNDKGMKFPTWTSALACKVFKSHSNKKHAGDLPILAITQDKGTVYREKAYENIKRSDASVCSYTIVEKDDSLVFVPFRAV